MADLEAGVQAMTAIVGDVGHSVLLSLLRREKGAKGAEIAMTQIQDKAVSFFLQCSHLS